jgi:hypothetical protein
MRMRIDWSSCRRDLPQVVWRAYRHGALLRGQRGTAARRLRRWCYLTMLTPHGEGSWADLVSKVTGGFTEPSQDPALKA